MTIYTALLIILGCYHVQASGVNQSANSNGHANSRIHAQSVDGPLNSLISLHDFAALHPDLSLDALDMSGYQRDASVPNSSSEEDADPGSPFSRPLIYRGRVPTFDMGLFGYDAGWYDGATDQDRDVVIREMHKRWHFPLSSLGLWQAAIHVRQIFTFNQAVLILDETISPSRERRRQIRQLAYETYPTLTEDEEQNAGIIRDHLQHLRENISNEYADKLILAAFKFEGMENMPPEAVVEHILYKIDNPELFENEQLLVYQRST